VSPFEVVAIIIVVFFAIGIVVGILLVAALPGGGGRMGFNGGPPQRFGESQPGPRDQPDTGPPAEPDDRDDLPWWANGR
jgi:hypothetical protein